MVTLGISHPHENWGRWQSGQMHQTVNLAAQAYGGSNPSLPTRTVRIQKIRGTVVGDKNAVVAQLVEHQPSKLRVAGSSPVRRSERVFGNHTQETTFNAPWSRISLDAYVAQSVEHVLGKDEVTGSSPVVGSVIDMQ